MDMRRSTALAAAITTYLLLIQSVSGAPMLPVYDAANFVPGAPVDHSYFPLVPNVKRVYQGEVDGTAERFELTYAGPGPTILRTPTHTQRDRAFEDDLLVEDTFDYYAQDVFGNVWYFGEDVTNYEYDDDGNLLGTNSSSSWRAGVNSALPGFIMPADLASGLHYYQEFAPFDAAIDEGQALASDRTLTIGIGTFDDVVAVLETLATDPGARGIKYFAPGIGLIAEDEGVALDFMSAEARLELTEISAVPLPAALPLLGTAVFVLLLRRSITRT